jgi:hypothetical protein
MPIVSGWFLCNEEWLTLFLIKSLRQKVAAHATTSNFKSERARMLPCLEAVSNIAAETGLFAGFAVPAGD